MTRERFHTVDSLTALTIILNPICYFKLKKKKKSLKSVKTKKISTPESWSFYCISYVNFSFIRLAIKREQKLCFPKNTGRSKLGIFRTTVFNTDNLAAGIVEETILWLIRKICNRKFYKGRVILLVVLFS